MKVNIQIEITDAQRNKLARYLDDKETKRLVTREELRQEMDGCLAGLLSATENFTTNPAPQTIRKGRGAKKSVRKNLSKGKIPEGMTLDGINDDPQLEGKPRGYRIGWNRVKFGLAARS